ncbi:MAG TPA: inorganic diphosphatase, partial [Candidatus Elarobacter sp.]|nr:inorganic diphosphatase [Candidatus Elarobacter sp.]
FGRAIPPRRGVTMANKAKASQKKSGRGQSAAQTGGGKTARRSRRRFVPLDELPPTDKDGLFNVVIETPKGSPNKLAYDPQLGTFKLSAVMPEGLTFPFDFGFIPGTLGQDGDPLDVLVLMDFPLESGTVVCTRLIGVIEGEQTDRDGSKEENDRVIAVSPESAQYRTVKKLSDVPEQVVEQIQQFFVNYNAQGGKVFAPKGQHGRKRAESCFETARRRFTHARG